MRPSTVALLIAIVALISMNATAEPGVSSGEIVIGSCASLSGSNRFNGQQTVAGGRVYFDSVNAEGGVYGRKIRLISLDHANRAQAGIICFKRLMDQGIFTAALLNSSPALTKIAPMSEAHRIPMVGFYAGAEFLYQPVRRYIFAVKPSFEDEIRIAIQQVWKRRESRRIGVLFESDAAGAPVLNGVRLELEKLGGEFAAAGSIDPDKTNGDESAIAAVRAADPEVVFIGGKYGRVSRLIRLARRRSWKPLFIAYSGVGDEEFVREAGEAAEGVVILSPVPTLDRTDLPTVARFLQAMKTYAPKERPTLVSLEGYVDAIVLVEGLKRAGKNLSRKGLVEALESIHGLNMGLGPELLLNYRPESHRGLDKVFFTIVRGGKIVTFSDWKTLK